MEKNIDWQQIPYQTNINNIPCKRWGHKTVFIEDQIVLFGGFSDVTYLSDLWAYNIHTNQWREIDTTGKKPQGKSNFTMHFDSVSNQLLIFGGGGPNKKRFNKISILNWQTKQWTQIQGDNENSPWQRTYHSSQFKYPYLITFGGEGAANIDFNDLWVFNIESKQWLEIKTSGLGQNSQKLQFQGRRFHSTTILGNQLFVISGCRVNYTCIPSIYSINLASLFGQQSKQNNQPNDFQNYYWKSYNFSKKQQELIQRWGHSSEAYNNKIYIFGGRNKDDYNDLLQFDPIKSTITKLITNQGSNLKLPKSRRRHSSCMIGSSMVIFGGFNMEYFNDMHFISLFKCRDTLQKQKYILNQNEQIIELEEAMFSHFLQELNKQKTQYDIEIIVESPEKQNPFVVRSKQVCLISKSLYFKNVMRYNATTNPQRNTVSVNLNKKQINLITFQIFNAFLLKDLLILPKNCGLKLLIQLLTCADYFQNSSLFQLIQKILIIKAIENQENIDDIFNIAANENLLNLLSVCTQKKILSHSYYNSHNKIVFLNRKGAKIKQKYITQGLLQIQFEELQKGPKRRQINKNKDWGKNIKQLNLVASQKGIEYINGKGKRKKSFVQKFLQSFGKFCTSSNDHLEQQQQERQSNSISQSQSSNLSQQNQLKMF